LSKAGALQAATSLTALVLSAREPSSNIGIKASIGFSTIVFKTLSAKNLTL